METGMKRQLTIETLPKRLLDEAREMLRGEDTVVEVIRWNGRMRVVGKVFPYEHSWDERLLLTIRETDLFTEAERTENYINYYHKYPSWYTGKRDEAMLERMRNDFDFDQETQTIREPVGRMVGGDFVYTGEVKATRLA
jgi:hypothetical protein